jgi:HSP20 family protein
MTLPLLRRNRSANGNTAARDDTQQNGRLASPWAPRAEFAELLEQMGRLITEFDRALAGAFGDRNGAWRPAADVEETDEAYLVELELPGVKREDVTVEFGGGELSVTGEVKKKERIGFLRTRTRPVGHFDYRVQLPAEVQEDQVSASLSDGVLIVRVPKTEKARRRRIIINSE